MMTHYTQAILQLRRALDIYNIKIPGEYDTPLYKESSPDLTRFKQLVLNHFDDEDFEFIEPALKNLHKPQWHLIAFGEGAAAILDLYDFIVAAETRDSALGFLIEAMSSSRVYPKQVTLDEKNGDISVYAGNQSLIANISKIRFESLNPAIYKRVQSALKGLSIFDNDEKMLNRLSGLPGLEQLVGGEGRPSETLRYCAHKTCANLCTNMVRVLSDITGSLLNAPLHRKLQPDSWAPPPGTN